MSLSWPAGKLLHGGGLSGARFDAYVTACGPGRHPAMASSFITVGKRAGGFTPIYDKLTQWLAGEKSAQRIPNVGFDLHDIADDGHTRTSNLAAILADKREVEFGQAVHALAEFGRPVLLRLGLEVTSDEYEIELFRAAYRKLALLVRTMAPQVALCFCIEPSAPHGGLALWYPDDDVVDCCGVDLYGRDTFTGPLLDSRGGLTAHGRAQDMANFARLHSKPLAIPECAPVGPGFHIGTTLEDAKDAWQQWFAPFVYFVKSNNVSAFAFMSQDWSSNGWSTSRLESNPYLAQLWREFLAKPGIVNAPS